VTAEPAHRAGAIARTPAAVRAALVGADRADFEAAYAAALDEARRTYRLEPVDQAVEQWWRYAVLSRSPGHAEAIEQARQLLAGEDVPVRPADLAQLRG
jgi:hypothetical protein